MEATFHTTKSLQSVPLSPLAGSHLRSIELNTLSSLKGLHTFHVDGNDQGDEPEVKLGSQMRFGLYCQVQEKSLSPCPPFSPCVSPAPQRVFGAREGEWYKVSLAHRFQGFWCPVLPCGLVVSSLVGQQAPPPFPNHLLQGRQVTFNRPVFH